MIAAGIVAEYNPFHNGHKYQIEETRRRTGADCIVAVMSGNFLQRGEPAIYDKWLRAEIAVRNGVDLVLELPFPFACGSAEFFAKGAVGILNGLGCIDYLSFGTECQDLNQLQSIAAVLAEESLGFQDAIKAFLKAGMPFAKARMEALKQISHEAGDDLFNRTLIEDILAGPNSILAIEYLKQLMRNKSSIQPVAIKRKGADYGEAAIQGSIASATAVRVALENGCAIQDLNDVLPSWTIEIIEQNAAWAEPVFSRSFYDLVRFQLLNSTEETLEQVFSAAEGLEKRAVKAAVYAKDYESLIQAIKSKRYTRTAVQRLLMHTLVNLTKSDMSVFLNQPCLYGRVLGISPAGRRLLKTAKETAGIPLITNANRALKEDGMRLKDEDTTLTWEAVGGQTPVCNQKAAVYDQGSSQLMDKLNPQNAEHLKKLSASTINEPVKRLLAFERKASNIYGLVSSNGCVYDRSDYKMKPFRLKTVENG